MIDITKSKMAIHITNSADLPVVGRVQYGNVFTDDGPEKGVSIHTSPITRLEEVEGKTFVRTLSGSVYEVVSDITPETDGKTQTPRQLAADTYDICKQWSDKPDIPRMDAITGAVQDVLLHFSFSENNSRNRLVGHTVDVEINDVLLSFHDLKKEAADGLADD